MAEKDNFGSFLVGFLIGGLAGAVVALLYAPAPGDETRTVIKDKAIELKDKTVETLDDTYKQASVAATDAVSKAQELIKQAQVKEEELTKKGQVILETVKETAKPKKSAPAAE
jgi:gas vesicle protein